MAFQPRFGWWFMVNVGKYTIRMDANIGGLFRRLWCSNRPPKSQWRFQEPSLIGTSLSSGTCGRSMFHQRLHLAENALRSSWPCRVVWHTFLGLEYPPGNQQIPTLGKGKISSKVPWDMLVPGSVVELLEIQVPVTFCFCNHFLLWEKWTEGIGHQLFQHPVPETGWRCSSININLT